MDYSSFRSLCELRRTVRYFDEKKSVTKEEIIQLLELAQMAPNIENMEPWRFHVVMNAEKMQELMKVSCYGNFIPGASVFIVVTADKSVAPATQETIWNPVELQYSCVVAMEHILLGAAAMGLGGGWVSLHHGPPHTILSLPTNEVVIGGLMIGHLRKGEEEPSTGHSRMPLEKIATFHE